MSFHLQATDSRHTYLYRTSFGLSQVAPVSAFVAAEQIANLERGHFQLGSRRDPLRVPAIRAVNGRPQASRPGNKSKHVYSTL